MNGRLVGKLALRKLEETMKTGEGLQSSCSPLTSNVNQGARMTQANVGPSQCGVSCAS